MRLLVRSAVRAARSGRALNTFKPTPARLFHTTPRSLCQTSEDDDSYSGFAHTLAERVENWSSSMADSDPDFFPKSAKGQSPKILWIGCADSRIPESTILGLKPGEVFVHRNIANIITATDINSLSVIEFAVAHLKVEHILVCGHTSCGGVNAALGNTRLGLLDIWLQPMRQLRMEHTEELEKLDTKQSQTLRLSQYNILRSLEVLRMNPTVIDAMHERKLELHGVIYHVENGKLEVVESSEDENRLKKRLAAFKTAEAKN